MNEQTFLNILSSPYDEFTSTESFLSGLILICKFTGSMNVTPRQDKVKTIRIKKLIGYGITEEAVIQLHGLGWFADEEGYLAWTMK